MLALFPVMAVGGVPEGWRQVWEMAGRGEPSSVPSLLQIIRANPDFPPAYRTLGEVFLRTHDRAGLEGALTGLNPGLAPVARRAYGSPDPREVYKQTEECLKVPNAGAACFEIMVNDGARAAALLRAWHTTGLERKTPAACIARVRLLQMIRRIDVSFREAAACLARAEASGDRQFEFYALLTFTHNSPEKMDVRAQLESLARTGSLAFEIGEYDLSFGFDFGRAFFLRNQGATGESDEIFRRLRETARSNGNDKHLADLARDEAVQHQQKGELDAAGAAVERAIAAYNRCGLDTQEYYLWWDLAASYQRVGDFPAARRLLTRSLDRIHELGHHAVQEAFVLRSLSLVAHESGDWFEALRYGHMSVDLFRAFGMTHQAGAGLGNIGLIHESLGDYTSALEMMQASMASAIRHEDRSSEASTLTGRAGIRLKLGDPEGAARDLGRAVRIGSAAERIIRESASLSLANVLVAQNKPAEASGYAASSLNYAREMKNRSFEADAELVLGDIKRQLRDADAARAHYQLSLEAARAGPYYDGVINAEGRLAEIARLRRDPEGEFAHLNRALEMIEADRMRIPTPDLRTAFSRQIAAVYDAAIENRIASGRVEEALLLSERNRARGFLDTMLESRAQPVADMAPELREQHGRLGMALSRAMSAMLAEDTPPNRAKASEAEKQLDAWFTRVRLANPAFLNNQSPSIVSPGEARMLAKDLGATIVSYTMGAARSHAWVISPEGIAFVALAGRGQIEAESRRQRHRDASQELAVEPVSLLPPTS